MKRPEGFDSPPAGPPEQPSARAPRAARPQKQTGVDKPTGPVRPKSAAKAEKARSTKRVEPEKVAAPSHEPTADREAKKAARSRRRYERSEVKRFTRRSRRRRITILVSVLSLVLTGVLVTGAVYSPLLSLTTVTVEGSSRVSADSVKSAIKDQVGKPLATIDFDRIKRQLSKFPLIRSYVTETVPPDTLIIRITERAPIGLVASSTGFTVVDPAGVEIETATDRPPGLPLIESGSASKKSPGFTAAVAVLLSLPAEVLKKVDTVTAHTTDDVTLGLTGAGQSVVWGSAENSALKARVLVALIATQSPNAAVKYDVSAPTHAVVGAG
ncbi:FtsQ-type POTRA domain-containing protein [Glaciihabitans sp. UYNi722]|uniref:FtsQ-type POTRA domain-containing protein n=1 Tax=Glaciihabitans sp. UYNi722 TaxID=3156344 RepID=UPI00339AF27D